MFGHFTRSHDQIRLDIEKRLAQTRSIARGCRTLMILRVKTIAGNALSLFVRRDSTTWHSLNRAYERAKNAIRALTKNSIFVEEQELGMCSLAHEKKLDIVLELFKPASVLDMGCGTGRALSYLRENGVDAFGVEGSELAISRSRHPNHITKHNLNRELNLGRKFDLVWCAEVVEHIHPRYEHNLLQTLVNHSDLIVLTAAQPGQGGEGHFNEQPFEYWIAKFRARGYSYDEATTLELRAIPEPYSENILVFRRTVAGAS
jgi:SAM-dependent methyltransferase